MLLGAYESLVILFGLASVIHLVLSFFVNRNKHLSMTEKQFCDFRTYDTISSVMFIVPGIVLFYINSHSHSLNIGITEHYIIAICSMVCIYFGFKYSKMSKSIKKHGESTSKDIPHTGKTEFDANSINDINICPKCQHKNLPDSNFCEQCGANMKEPI